MALARDTQGLQIACARRFNALRGRRGALFSDRHHPRPLATLAEVRHAVS